MTGTPYASRKRDDDFEEVGPGARIYLLDFAAMAWRAAMSGDARQVVTALRVISRQRRVALGFLPPSADGEPKE
jgi:hypothetical protein